MSGPRNLKKHDILFREGENSEAMYIIKSGKIAITKIKGPSEIILAELGPGDMLGEMAFFDNKPRSATAKAISDSVIIELPFKALNAQLNTFPEWLKAIMRTVNTHLRNANQKIKQLEKSSEEDTMVFPPYTVTRLCAILGLVAARYGEKTDNGVLVPPNRLRNYTIQIFQQPTAKMDKLIDVLQGFGYMKREDLGEGKTRLTLYNLEFILGFTDFYNDFLFKPEEKRTTIEEKELKTLKALAFYGQKQTPNDKGEVTVNLTQMQNDSMKDLGFLFNADDVNSLVEKKVTSDKISGEGSLSLKFHLGDMQTTYPYWDLIHALRKFQRN
jgi:CRP-like cAMP-binding protein